MKTIMRFLPPVLFAAGLLALWYVATDLRLVSPVFLPTPARTFDEIASRFADGSIWASIGATVFINSLLHGTHWPITVSLSLLRMDMGDLGQWP